MMAALKMFWTFLLHLLAFYKSLVISINSIIIESVLKYFKIINIKYQSYNITRQQVSSNSNKYCPYTWHCDIFYCNLNMEGWVATIRNKPVLKLHCTNLEDDTKKNIITFCEGKFFLTGFRFATEALIQQTLLFSFYKDCGSPLKN